MVGQSIMAKNKIC